LIPLTLQTIPALVAAVPCPMKGIVPPGWMVAVVGETLTVGIELAAMLKVAVTL
jgi:hypothetical protein